MMTCCPRCKKQMTKGQGGEGVPVNRYCMCSDRKEVWERMNPGCKWSRFDDR